MEKKYDAQMGSGKKYPAKIKRRNEIIAYRVHSIPEEKWQKTKKFCEIYFWVA